MKNFLPLSASTWDSKEIQAIRKLFSRKYFTMGKKVKIYEKKFAKYIGSKYAIAVNSGSSANLLIIASLFFLKNKKFKLREGDEIIVPSIGWSTSYAPLQQYKLKIKFVDIDEYTLNYDTKILKKAITKNTRAILCINILGNPNNYNEIKKIIKGKKIFLIEDNCESLGAKFNKTKVGNFGIASSFSTYFSHHISTIEGGMITTNNQEVYETILSLRSHGWTRDLGNKNKLVKKKKDNFYEKFNFILPGYNLRPTEITAVLGIEQLKKLSKFIKIRKVNANYLKKILKNNKNIYIQNHLPGSSHFAFALIIKKNSKVKLIDLRKKLDHAGIEYRPIITGDFTRQIVTQKYFEYLVYGKLKNASHIDRNGLMFGNHHYDIRKKLNFFKNFF